MVPRILIALATLLGICAIFGIWADRQLLDTDEWVETSGELIADEAIQSRLADYLSDELFSRVDVAAELQGVLPPQAQRLAPVAASGLEELGNRAAQRIVEAPRTQQAWRNANRRAHELFVNVVEGGGENVSTEGGAVTIDLRALLERLADRLGVGEQLAEKLPADAGQVTVMRSDQLDTLQTLVDLLNVLAIVLTILTLALLALAVYLGRDRRAQTLMACGFSLVGMGLAALILRGIAGGAVVDAVAGPGTVAPAADAVWEIGTSVLAEVAGAAILLGLLVIAGAWLGGPWGAAARVRRFLAPVLAGAPEMAYGAAFVLFLLFLWWGPIPATRRFVPVLVLLVLFMLGVAALRRLTRRETAIPE